MKAVRLSVCMLCAGMLVASCNESEKEMRAILDFEGTYWDALIDDVQYGGALLYGETASGYRWIDEHTQLSGGMTNAWGGMYGFSEGGIAISNYVSDDFENHKDFNHQLEAPSTIGGKNFAMVYCDAELTFMDGKAHVIESMQICPSTYLIGIALYGNEFCKTLGTDDFLTLHIQADNGVAMQVDLLPEGKIQDTWKKVDLSGLGAVKSIRFSMTGSDSTAYGMNTPAYVAVDNIEIVL